MFKDGYGNLVTLYAVVVVDDEEIQEYDFLWTQYEIDERERRISEIIEKSDMRTNCDLIEDMEKDKKKKEEIKCTIPR